MPSFVKPAWQVAKLGLTKGHKNKTHILELAMEEPKIKKTSGNSTRKKLSIIMLILTAIVFAVMFASAQAATSVPPAATAGSTPSPNSPAATLVQAANNQYSSLEGIPVLGLILGLASIAAFFMERVIAHSNHN